MPGVYAVTTTPTVLHYRDGKKMVGYFQTTRNSGVLLTDNKYTFIEMNNGATYRNQPDDQYVTVVDGDLLVDVVQN